MIVWVVGIGDCEGNHIKAICASKKIAERELFKARDELVVEWKEMREFNRERDSSSVEMYERMIIKLSSDDYENWENYPHEAPYIYETEVIKQ